MNVTQADISTAKTLLHRIIAKQADEKALSWLEQQSEKLTDSFSRQKFYLAFSTASRHFQKDILTLTEADRQEAAQLRKGFQPEHWHLLQTARTYLLLYLPSADREQYLQLLDKLFETADMDEQVALYAALPLLPYPEDMRQRASEGLRTNMTVVFDAIALHNPYPADYLKEEAWNQMLLKAVFMQRPLYQIERADERANEELARILIDFAHERWAAHRNVMPELWRFVAPFLQEKHLSDIEKAVRQGDALEVEAALLACAQSSYSGAREILKQHPEIGRKIASGMLTWEDIGRRYAGH